MRARSVLKVLVVTSLLAACSRSAETDAESVESEVGTVPAVCSLASSGPFSSYATVMRQDGEADAVSGGTPKIANYTSWPTYDRNVGWSTAKYDASIVAARTSVDDARKNLASRFEKQPDCVPKMEEHLATKKPNVYVYFTGYGSPTQQNALNDQPALMRWINKRDPKALIFSVNWSCPESHDTWCKENGARLAVTAAAPEYQHMMARVNAALAGMPDGQRQAAAAQFEGLLSQTAAKNGDYNEGLSHAMQLAALLIDQVLVADIGDVRVLGYSMGAHAASQLMIQDFVGDGKGFKWTAPGACDDGTDTCTVAHLKKVKWSLGLGVSGWSDGLRAYNTNRSAEDVAQHWNGGLLRLEDERFNGKSNVFNRRMDPTGNSNDIFERGFNNVIFQEYNHVSHDYAMPVFTSAGFDRMLDAFLEAPSGVKDSVELGAYYDNAGLVDFDDCREPGAACAARTNYLDHANGSHPADTIPLVEVKTTDGVPHPDRTNNRAVSFVDTGAPIALRTFDQEDLRGGVELYYRPQFDTAAVETHGLFSYGACEGSEEDLMPQAYVENGNIVFAMRYLGQEYKASLPVADPKVKLEKGKWTHLAFTWELPVVAMPSLPERLPGYVGKYGQSFIVASGLKDAPPTTYRRQEGAGQLRVFANGKLAASAPLGAADSQRDCLDRASVVGSSTYNPYGGYTTDAAAVVSGTICKAYRVRNTQAFFGCAKSRAAAGDMDDLTLIWGPGRTAYDNVDPETGAPRAWPIGVPYTNKPFVVR
jgi:hypothetical protein